MGVIQIGVESIQRRRRLVVHKFSWQSYLRRELAEALEVLPVNVSRNEKG